MPIGATSGLCAAEQQNGRRGHGVKTGGKENLAGAPVLESAPARCVEDRCGAT